MNVESLRELCLTLPGTTEDVKWGNDLVFSVGAKMYAATGLEGPFGISFKVTEDDFAQLTQREGIVPAPYLARAKWIRADRETALTPAEWEALIRSSYALVKSRLTKKLQREIDEFAGKTQTGKTN